MLSRVWRDWNSPATGALHRAAAEQHRLMDPPKSNTELPCGPAVPLPGTCPKVKAGTQRDVRTPRFSAAARGVRALGATSRCVGEQNVRCPCGETGFGHKRNEVLPHATARMDRKHRAR